MKTNREYRNFAEDIELRAENENNYIVEGYASTFEPYVLFEMEGEKFSERIDPKAFRNADMSDVVFRIDHEGAVFARTSNNTIQLYPDDHGLHVRADLSRTEKARGIFEDIREGMYPKMSFAFVVEDDGDEKRCREMSASYLQGYKYSRPVPIERLREYLPKAG